MRIRLLTALLVLFPCLCPLSGQESGLDFETDIPPKFSFSETYTDTVVVTDPEFGDYELVPKTTMKVTAVCSMTGVDLNEIDEDTAISIDFDGLVETWFLSDDPNYEKGKTSATIPLMGYDFITGEELEIGAVTAVWTSKTVTITISAKNDPDTYQIMAQDRAFEGEETNDYNDLTTVTLSFADRELTGRVVYVTGTISYSDYESGEIFETLANVDLQGAIDSTVPVIKMLNPVEGSEINDRNYVLRGSVTDDHGVGALFVRINEEPEVEVAVDAEGNWSTPVSFIAGQNTIHVRATDQDENLGTLKPRKIVFLVESDLVVRAAGTAAGQVSSSFFPTLKYFPGQLSPERIALKIDGEKIVLKATPAADALFAGWTSNYPLANSDSPTLTFRMEPDMIVTANFAPNIFLPVRGDYTGLLESDNPLGRGSFTLKLGANGSFTGSVRIGKTVVRLKGKFGVDGHFTGVMKAGKQKYEVTLSLSQSAGGSNQLVGTFQPQIAEGSTTVPFESSVVSDLAVYKKKVREVGPELFGAYNALITPTLENDDPNFPVGQGYARVVLSKFGVARFTGTLGDGTPFTSSGKLSEDNFISVYAALYKKKGSVSGRVKFDRNGFDSDLAGNLNCFRPVTGTSGLAAGFAGPVRIRGVKYVKPAAGSRLFLISDGAGEVALDAPAEGDLEELAFQSQVTLTAENRLVVTDSSLGLTIKFKPATGLFSGKFREQPTDKPTKVAGAVLISSPGLEPKGNVAGGWFRRGSATGAIQITPPSVPIP